MVAVKTVFDAANVGKTNSMSALAPWEPPSWGPPAPPPATAYLPRLLRAARHAAVEIRMHWQGDLTGAISAAVVTLPQAISYGILAFAPLGASFSATAALLGIYTAIFAGIMAAALGGSTIQITGPKAPLMLIVASLVTQLALDPRLPAVAPFREALVVGLVALTVLLGGVVQIAFGMLGLGNLIRYVPRPVVAGFLNGIACTLIAGQVPALLGWDNKSVDWTIQPLTLAIGLTTMVVILQAPRILKALPASVTGLCVGCAAYHIASHYTDPSRLGSVITIASQSWPIPDKLTGLLRAGDLAMVASFLPDLVLPALLLGLVGALESLLGCAAIDSLTGTRHHADRELIGQGAGNAVSALFGSIFAAGSVPRTMASFRAGGRTRAAGVLTSAVLLLVVVALAPLLPPIPRVVIAALIVTVGITMLDGWTIGLLAKLLHRVRGGWPALREEKAIAVDLAVTIAVAAATVVLSLAAAVALGMVIASALFLAKIGKAIIRRRYRGDQVHSRKVRVRPLTEILETEGWRIAVYELQGTLFFGSAENLAREVEDSAPTFTHCILDLALVTEIDSTGASSLVELDRRLAQAGARLSLSHVEPGLPLWQVFESMDVLDAIGREDCYSDTDAALEAAEEALLAQLTHLGDVGVPISLDQMEITEGLTPAELAALGARLCPQTYQQGALVICKGAADRDLYFLTRGTISVGSRSQEGQRTRRLRSFTAGVVFGEMAMLDGKPRSADVWAEEDVEMLCLSLQEFERLQTREPALAVKLTLNLTKAIARNLRRASREIAALG